MAHCGWYRPSLIWAVMLGETESMPDWCLSNPLVGWLLASHTAGCRPSVCVMTALWKNHYCRGLTSVVIKLHHSTEKGGQSYNLSHMIDIKRRKAMSVTLYIHMHPGEVNHKIQGKKITSKMVKKRKDKEKKFIHGTDFLSVLFMVWRGLFARLCQCKAFTQACDLDIVFSAL